jgi:hypothetical protein
VLRRAAHRAEDVLSPRRADSAHTITMIAVVTMPVIADTAPCMPDVARLAMSARRPAGRDSGAIGGKRRDPRFLVAQELTKAALRSTQQC